MRTLRTITKRLTAIQTDLATCRVFSSDELKALVLECAKLGNKACTLGAEYAEVDVVLDLERSVKSALQSELAWNGERAALRVGVPAYAGKELVRPALNNR